MMKITASAGKSLLRSIVSKRAIFSPSIIPSTARLFHSSSFVFSRKYTEDHEWVSVKDGVATMGITEYAQNSLGDVVYVEVPEVGSVVSQKDPVGAVESVKAASDIYAPISGEIVEVNAQLGDEPSLINKSSYEQGWIAKIKLSNPSELDGLLDEEAYKKHTDH